MDVWKRHCFAWEYKGKHVDLDGAFDQLRQYALALENPPLLIVSDMARFRIRTNWTNSVSATHEFVLENLVDAGTRDKLKWAMSDQERMRPGESRQALTGRAAATFAELAQSLRERGHDPAAEAAEGRGMTAGTRCRATATPTISPALRPAGLPVRSSASQRCIRRLVPAGQIEPTGTIMPTVVHKIPNSASSSAAC